MPGALCYFSGFQACLAPRVLGRTLQTTAANARGRSLCAFSVLCNPHRFWREAPLDTHFSDEKSEAQRELG